MKSKLLLSICCLFIIIAFPKANFACSCLAKPSVLDSFESSDLVIIAKALSVEMTDEAEGVDIEAMNKKAGYDVSYRYVKSTKMVVEKVYKGNVKVGDEVIFGQGGGADCIWTFGVDAVGISFLFYVDKPSTSHPFINDIKLSNTPMYYPITCGRSQSILKYETDDLKYLNKIEKVKGKTRISGDFNCWSRNCPNFANLKVNIIGDNKTFQIQTDENGFYEIYDLPPGKYLLEPETPKGWKINQFMLQYSPAFRNMESLLRSEEKPDLSKQIPVILEVGKHTGIDFYFDVDTAISGKVLSPAGKPMKGVCVTAVSTELKEGDYRGRFDCTNDEGIFLIEEMSPDKYILVVNNDGKLSESEPFGTLFYPNTTKFTEAKLIEVKLGERLDGFVIRVPKTEELVKISGKWTYSDGEPVADEWIKYDVDEKSDKVDGKQRVETDENGNFTFNILKGLKGSFYGKIYTYVGEFENCPQTDNALREASGGKTNGYLETESVSIDATKNLSNLSLKFTFPSCKKKD